MDDDRIVEIFRNAKTIAVVGFSRNPDKPARRVPKFLKSRGYRIIPINPFIDHDLGEKAYPSVSEIPEDLKIDVVEVFRPSNDTPEIVKQVAERKKRVGDVWAVWLQEGIKHPESKKIAQDAGLTYIEDKCMYKEYIRLIEPKNANG